MTRRVGGRRVKIKVSFPTCRTVTWEENFQRISVFPSHFFNFVENKGQRFSYTYPGSLRELSSVWVYSVVQFLPSLLTWKSQLRRADLRIHKEVDTRAKSRLQTAQCRWISVSESLVKASQYSVRNLTEIKHYFLYSKHPHVRTHNVGGQADWVIIYRVLNDKSASKCS